MSCWWSTILQRLWGSHIMVNFFLCEVFSSVYSFYLRLFLFSFDGILIPCYVSALISMGKVTLPIQSCWSVTFFLLQCIDTLKFKLCFLREVRSLQFTVVLPHRKNVKLHFAPSSLVLSLNLDCFENKNMCVCIFVYVYRGSVLRFWDGMRGKGENIQMFHSFCL